MDNQKLPEDNRLNTFINLLIYFIYKKKEEKACVLCGRGAKPKCFLLFLF